MNVVPFNPTHFEIMDLIPEQIFMKDMVKDPQYCELLLQGAPYTLKADGRIIGCGGVFLMTPYIARAWALVSPHSAQNMIGATRFVKKYFDSLDVRRIETLVLRGYDKGERWVKMLGFELETPKGMSNYGFNGETYDLYSICK